MRVCLLSVACLFVAVGLSGCAQDIRREGPELAKVTGSVSLDGEPVEGAHVRFSPETKGPAAFAVSDSRGHFELRTFDPGDGAVPGKYGISITKDVTEGGKEFASEAEMEAYTQEHGKAELQRTTVSALPEKYASKQSSGLTAEISLATKNHFDLELTSK